MIRLNIVSALMRTKWRDIFITPQRYFNHYPGW